MAREYKRISADSHLEVSNDRWTHRIDPKYRDQGPKAIVLPNGGRSFSTSVTKAGAACSPIEAPRIMTIPYPGAIGHWSCTL